LTREWQTHSLKYVANSSENERKPASQQWQAGTINPSEGHVLTDALELGLERFLVAGVGDVEEEIRVLGLQKLRGRHRRADAQHTRRSIGARLTPEHNWSLSLHLSAGRHFLRENGK